MKLVDMTGKKFGNLVVLERAPNKNHKVRWFCKCSCNRIISANTTDLMAGRYKTCGKSGCRNGRNFIDLVGQKFGRWTVLSKSNLRKSGNQNQLTWLCKCDCGTEKEVRGDSLRNRTTISCGCFKLDRIKLVAMRSKVEIVTIVKSKRRISNLPNKQIRRRIYSSKGMASRRGIIWTLSQIEAESIVVRPCNYCKFEMNLESDEINGIDRVDNNLGYIPGNCVPCCWRCNHIKGDATVDDIDRLQSILNTLVNLKNKKSLPSENGRLTRELGS